MLPSLLLSFPLPCKTRNLASCPTPRCPQQGPASQCPKSSSRLEEDAHQILQRDLIPPCLVAHLQSHLIFPYVELASGNEVAGMHPKFNELQTCAGRGVIITGAAPCQSGFDFFTLFFCPKLGVNEEKGSYGTVYKYRDLKTSELVAVKFISLTKGVGYQGNTHLQLLPLQMMMIVTMMTMMIRRRRRRIVADDFLFLL